jgi:hypothetical protein
MKTKQPYVGIYRYREKGRERVFKTPPFFARNFSSAKENIYRAAAEIFRDVELLSLSVRAVANPSKRKKR